MPCYILRKALSTRTETIRTCQFPGSPFRALRKTTAQPPLQLDGTLWLVSGHGKGNTGDVHQLQSGSANLPRAIFALFLYTPHWIAVSKGLEVGVWRDDSISDRRDRGSCLSVWIRACLLFPIHQRPPLNHSKREFLSFYWGKLLRFLKWHL